MKNLVVKKSFIGPMLAVLCSVVFVVSIATAGPTPPTSPEESPGYVSPTFQDLKVAGKILSSNFPDTVVIDYALKIASSIDAVNYAIKIYKNVVSSEGDHDLVLKATSDAFNVTVDDDLQIRTDSLLNLPDSTAPLKILNPTTNYWLALAQNLVYSSTNLYLMSERKNIYIGNGYGSGTELSPVYNYTLDVGGHLIVRGNCTLADGKSCGGVAGVTNLMNEDSNKKITGDVKIKGAGSTSVAVDTGTNMVTIRSDGVNSIAADSDSSLVATTSTTDNSVTIASNGQYNKDFTIGTPTVNKNLTVNGSIKNLTTTTSSTAVKVDDDLTVTGSASLGSLHVPVSGVANFYGYIYNGNSGGVVTIKDDVSIQQSTDNTSQPGNLSVAGSLTVGGTCTYGGGKSCGTSVEGISGDIDLIAGSGISISPNSTGKTITFSASSSSPPLAYKQTNVPGPFVEVTPPVSALSSRKTFISEAICASGSISVNCRLEPYDPIRGTAKGLKADEKRYPELVNCSQELSDRKLLNQYCSSYWIFPVSISLGTKNTLNDTCLVKAVYSAENPSTIFWTQYFRAVTDCMVPE